MSFLWPQMLAGLALVPVFIGIYVLFLARNRDIVARHGALTLASEGSGKRIGFARHVAWILFLIGFAGLVVAMARPQTEVTLPRIEGTVILAFDVSGSMAATDLEPTRMEAAKAAARAFLEHQPPSVQIGIVAFSDSGFSVQVPTNDAETVLAAIDRLSPQRGTSLADGIQVSLRTIATARQPDTHFYSNPTPGPTPVPTHVPRGTYTSAVIVLLSDGENNLAPDPMAAANLAADRGVRVYTVGLGSAAGQNLHINGFTVHTRLDEVTLQQIAKVTGGKYYNARSQEQLVDIYSQLNPELVLKPEKTEVTAIVAGASALMFLVGALYSLMEFGRVI